MDEACIHPLPVDDIQLNAISEQDCRDKEI